MNHSPTHETESSESSPWWCDEASLDRALETPMGDEQGLWGRRRSQLLDPAFQAKHVDVASRVAERCALLEHLSSARATWRTHQETSSVDVLALRVRARLDSVRVEEIEDRKARFSWWIGGAACAAAVLVAVLLRPFDERPHVRAQQALDPAVMRAIDLAALPTASSETQLDVRTCELAGSMDPRSNALVHKGAWKVGQCYEPTPIAGSAGATLFRAKHFATAGLVVRGKDALRPIPTKVDDNKLGTQLSSSRQTAIGITRMRGFVVYDIAHRQGHHFLAVPRDVFERVSQADVEHQHCVVCHNQIRIGVRNPHRLFERQWTAQ